MKHFVKKCIGLSRDRHTNRWRFTCIGCRKIFEPPTTMFRFDTITCPKCGIEENIDYNEE